MSMPILDPQMNNEDKLGLRWKWKEGEKEKIQHSDPSKPTAFIQLEMRELE